MIETPYLQEKINKTGEEGLIRGWEVEDRVMGLCMEMGRREVWEVI